MGDRLTKRPPASIQVAVFSLTVYCLAYSIYGLFYKDWIEDPVRLLRVAIRVGGIGAISWGLWNQDKWGWWGALLFAPLMAVFGPLRILIGLQMRSMAQQPFHTADLLIELIMTLSAVVCLFVLMRPESRQILRSDETG